MLAMIAATLLDVVTTWVIISNSYGFEANPVLAPLVRHSLFWIPVYLLCRPLLLPLLPCLCRFGFVTYFGISSLLFGVNNLSGILWGHYFLMDNFGLAPVEAACALMATAVFISKLWKVTPDIQGRRLNILVALFWIGIFALIELGFFAVGQLTRVQ